MDRPEKTLTFGERPGGLTARAGWTWGDDEDSQDGVEETEGDATAQASGDARRVR